MPQYIYEGVKYRRKHHRKWAFVLPPREQQGCFIHRNGVVHALDAIHDIFTILHRNMITKSPTLSPSPLSFVVCLLECLELINNIIIVLEILVINDTPNQLLLHERLRQRRAGIRKGCAFYWPKQKNFLSRSRGRDVPRNVEVALVAPRNRVRFVGYQKQNPNYPHASSLRVPHQRPGKPGSWWRGLMDLEQYYLVK